MGVFGGGWWLATEDGQWHAPAWDVPVCKALCGGIGGIHQEDAPFHLRASGGGSRGYLN